MAVVTKLDTVIARLATLRQVLEELREHKRTNVEYNALAKQLSENAEELQKLIEKNNGLFHAAKKELLQGGPIYEGGYFHQQRHSISCVKKNVIIAIKMHFKTSYLKKKDFANIINALIREQYARSGGKSLTENIQELKNRQDDIFTEMKKTFQFAEQELVQEITDLERELLNLNHIQMSGGKIPLEKSPNEIVEREKITDPLTIGKVLDDAISLKPSVEL